MRVVIQAVLLRLHDERTHSFDQTFGFCFSQQPQRTDNLQADAQGGAATFGFVNATAAELLFQRQLDHGGFTIVQGN